MFGYFYVNFDSVEKLVWRNKKNFFADIIPKYNLQKATFNVRKEEFQFVRETIFPFEFQTNAKKVNKLILVQPRKEF